MAHAADLGQVTAVQLLKFRHFWLSLILVLVLNEMVLVLVLVLDAVSLISSSTSTANAEYEYEKPWDRTDWGSEGPEKRNLKTCWNA